jgi:uncharacterized protein (TIGR00369 family)
MNSRLAKKSKERATPRKVMAWHASHLGRSAADGNAFQRRMQRIRAMTHAGCAVCGATDCRGLHVHFRARPDGRVTGVFKGHPDLQGYPNTLHGGMVSTLLDAAMTNCLFAHGFAAVTAELTVRFLRPVAADRPVTMSAWIEKSWRRLHFLAAELRQEGELMATAAAKFLVRIRPFADAVSD